MPDGNGNMGGFMPWMGGPGQREIVRRSERDEIGADDARGQRVVLLNIIIVCVAMSSMLLIGPLVIVLAVAVSIIALAWWLVGWPWNIHDEVSDRNASSVWTFTALFVMTWLFIVDNWLWEYIAAWYPIRWIAPFYITIPLWAICAAALYGLRDLREAHRRSLYNRNWPPLYESMPPMMGPYFKDWYDPSREQEPEQIIVDRVVPRPIPMFSNGNGNQALPNPIPPRDDDDVPESFKAPTGHTCMWRELVEFIWTGLEIGIATPTWHKRKGWGKPYIGALQQTLKQHGLAESKGEGSPFKLTITTKSQAAHAISMLHQGLYPDKYPPAPPCQPTVQAGNTSDLDGHTAKDGQTV